LDLGHVGENEAELVGSCVYSADGFAPFLAVMVGFGAQEAKRVVNFGATACNGVANVFRTFVQLSNFFRKTLERRELRIDFSHATFSAIHLFREVVYLPAHLVQLCELANLFFAAGTDLLFEPGDDFADCLCLGFTGHG
jgi:hypothetical protein